ncbi:MAG: poly-gamma-glutamate synthase PgsB [Polyangiaceae bacterium]
MAGIEVLAGVTGALALLGAAELRQHRRSLRSIPTRVHVNGTRGKSSVTRLIAAGLREGGLRTCAKTTGTLARMILPDGKELPIYRPSGPNIIEQKRIVGLAATERAQALVIECMALQPFLQSLSELKLVQATHGVITNARPDHLDVMGPSPADVARALAGTVPVGGKLFTAERDHLHIFAAAAADRNTKLVATEPAEPEALAGFTYTEHPDNVGLALAVCEDLGIEREVALQGMWSAQPDPGAMTEREVDFFGRRIVFVNGFAANDPVSTTQIWRMALERHADLKRRIAVFNCRADRPERSLELGRELARWPAPDHVLLMGNGTYLFARSAVRAGFDAQKLHFAEGQATPAVFERIVALAQDGALVMGLGNIGGGGLKLAAYFDNRARLPEAGP